MFEEENILVGLEIGTSKICAVVGEVLPDGAMMIIGIGQSESRAVRKGEIKDASVAVDDIRRAIAEAEQSADVEIRNLYLGVTGSHLQGMNNRGVHPIVSVDRDICEDDIEDVVRNAKAVGLPMGHQAFHSIRQYFAVDGQEGIRNPMGMAGTRLEADMHVIHGNLNRILTSVRAVQSLNLEVEQVVFNGLASYLALLNQESRESGTLLIDIGAGSTEYIVCTDGVVRHSGVLAIGGDHVTNDIAYGLKVPLGRAEQLKIDFGSAVVSSENTGQTIGLTNDEAGMMPNKINREHLHQIISARLEEVLQILENEMNRLGIMDYLRKGIIITGGVSKTKDLQRIAERVFQLPVRIGVCPDIQGVHAVLEQPEFSCGIGLVKFGAIQAQGNPRKSSLAAGFKNRVSRFFRKSELQEIDNDQLIETSLNSPS